MSPPTYTGPLIITGLLAFCIGCASIFNIFTIVAMGLSLIQLQRYMSGERYDGNEKISGKTVLITGANSGLGKETAKELARRGGRIIMACRNMEKAENAKQEITQETGSLSVVCMKLDLASLESVRAFAEEFNRNEDRLDILINNGGVMMCPKMLTQDGIEIQFGVNHIGHFLLTNLVLDKLKSSAPSRIIVMSSLSHNWETIHFDDLNLDNNYDSLNAYSQSKLANMLHVHGLSKRLKGTRVTVNGHHPGLVNTEIGRYIPGLSSPVLRALTYPVRSIIFKSPVQGIQTTLRLALDPTLETVTGKYFSDCEEKPANPRALDDEVSERLWKISEELTTGKEH